MSKIHSLFEDDVVNPVPNDVAGEVVFESKARLIGKTYWKMCVYRDSSVNVAKETAWWGKINPERLEERRLPFDLFTMYVYYTGSSWKKENTHPRYNSHDGTYAGLPKTLVKIYEENMGSIESFCIN